MKQTNIILLSVVLIVIICASTFGALTLLKTPASNPESTPTAQPTVPPTVNPTSTATSTPIPQTSIFPAVAPSTAPQPITTPEPSGAVTVVDASGASVTVQRPVNRIVCLTSVEMVYALGGGNKIVGIAGMLTTDVHDVLPSAILQLPTVGDKDTSPNMEAIIELKPDLILASQRLTDANRKQFRDAGIAVIEDSTTGARRDQYITNLGLILNQQNRATEIISYEQHYWNLVKERVANLPRSEKPLVYFEWYKDWFSTGPGGSYTGLIETAGGINVGENASVSSPQLSSEFVMEKNPDIAIRMLDVTSGESYSSFQTLYSSITSRTGMSNLNAAKNNHIYVIKSTLLVERDVVGLLYFAKWFHPDLFADIDPAAVHAEMIQKYYGTTLTGVYLYP